MSISQLVVDRLRQALNRNTLIPFVGAGVSKAAAGLPNWPEVARLAVRFLRTNASTMRSRKARIDEFENLVNSGDLLATFDRMQVLMKSTHRSHLNSEYYRAFLDETFGDPLITNRDLLDALSDLGAPVVVTTNYDTLIETAVMPPSVDSVTWLNAPKALGIVRGESSGVIHLHGRYDEPESVVLSQRDYQRIIDRRDEFLTHLSSALFYGGTLLLIGTSLDGAQDPHLRALLDAFQEAAGRGRLRTPHVLLTKGKVSGVERAQLAKYGIEAHSYGDSFKDLPIWLDNLVASRRYYIRADSTRDLLFRLRKAKSLSQVIESARDYIQTIVFEGEDIRVGYVEKTTYRGYDVLTPMYLLPPGTTGNRFIYPTTLAAWSLVEGQIIEFPNELDRMCDWNRLEKLEKAKRIKSQISSLVSRKPANFFRYLKRKHVESQFQNHKLCLRDFFQDWEADQPSKKYSQFISVPVPVVYRSETGSETPEYGVFNIDSKSNARPLLTSHRRHQLEVVSELVAYAYERRGLHR